MCTHPDSISLLLSWLNQIYLQQLWRRLGSTVPCLHGTCTEDTSLGQRSLGHPPEGLQLPAEMVSIFFGCEKLFFTQLDQSLLQNLHPCTLEPSNLRENEHVTCIHRSINWMLQDTLETTEKLGVSPPFWPLQRCVQSQPVLFSTPPPSDEYVKRVIILNIQFKAHGSILRQYFKLLYNTDTCWSYSNIYKMPRSILQFYVHTHSSLLYRFGFLNILSGCFQLHKFTGSPEEHFLQSHAKI